MSVATSPSLSAHVAPFDAQHHVLALGYLGETLAVVRADGVAELRLGDARLEVRLNADATLVVASNGRRLIAGGADGRVVALTADGGVETLGEAGGRWIDAVAIGPAGAVAWSCGREAFCREKGKPARGFSAPSTVRGLVFAPKGLRLAAAHVDGASLWFPNGVEPPDRLEWKGSHLDVVWSPDGRFVVTSMQENTLHGWRLPEKQHMRMSGYPSKIRSFTWSHDGKWLATSGADAAIIWPFAEKTGPMGKPPRECGLRRARVTQAAFHPHAYVLAIGYDDGCVLLCRLTDASELLVRPAGRDGGKVTALAWDGEGARLAMGTEGGEAGVLTLPARG